MDANFWHGLWKDNQLGFHESEFNPLMVQHFKQLPIAAGGRVFVPLCGKSLDMHWLLAQGFHIVGCELSALAVEQFFEELNLVPEIIAEGATKHYRYENIDIFAGDIFDLTVSQIGKIDAIYDRGALVALPLDMRIKYCAHLSQVSQKAPQFVLTFEYDQSLLQGPPFAIFQKDIQHYYQTEYKETLATSHELEGGLKGLSTVQECAWLLTPNP